MLKNNSSKHKKFEIKLYYKKKTKKYETKKTVKTEKKKKTQFVHQTNIIYIYSVYITCSCPQISKLLFFFLIHISVFVLNTSSSTSIPQNPFFEKKVFTNF